MSIEWFRDLIICIFGVTSIVVIILIAILVVSLYRKSKNVLQSIEIILKNIQETSSSLRKYFISPIAGMIVFFQGMNKSIEAINNIFYKKKGEKQNG